MALNKKLIVYKFHIIYLTILSCVLLLLANNNNIQYVNGDGGEWNNEVTKIDALRSEYLNMEQNMWKYINELSGPNNNNINNNNVRKLILSTLFTKYEEFITKELSDNFITNEFNILSSIYEWKVLEIRLITVDTLFQAYRLFLNHSMANELSAIDFSETVLNDQQWPVNKTLDQIENIMIRQGMYYKAMLEAQGQVCETRQSAQQVLYQLYKCITIIELKAHAMMQFSFMLLRTYNKGNYIRESQITRNTFEYRTQQSQDLLKNVMQRAERIVWRCDAKVQVEGETYESITRLLQGYIENEVDMNNDNTCKENCAHYQYSENFGCYENMYCSKQPKCKGKLLNCRFIESDMTICPSRAPSKRRYEYIEYDNGRSLGKNGGCTTGTTKVESWWRWIFWHCSYCLCVCDEQGSQSDRYFNLREVTSNITENNVVTGLRFRKRNRIIHLQIQEGQLIERGSINETTLKWKPISEYGLLDRGIKNGIDYHTMAWDRRAIDLDDLIAPVKHVCTGVRFRVVGAHLNLEMRITEFDFINGRFIAPEQSIWVSNDNTERTQIKLNQPDIPILSKSQSKIDSTTNQYIEFTHSDIDRDVAQTTVPYLDAQDVTSIPPVALAGVGLYHKGLNMYGGFVAPKLITYDFTSHIDTPTPPVKEENAIEMF